MSLFDELAELSIRVQPDADEPHQWIYAVDDAWFHPEDSEVNIALNQDENARLRCLSIFMYESKGRAFRPDTVPFTIVGGAGGVNATFNQGDKTAADRLIQFVQEKAEIGLRYGVCFCSFEYFWKNIATIDTPQNAVLFDIRHALGWSGSTVTRVEEALDLGSLRDDWKGLIEGTEMFGAPDANEIMARLGWYLHYALKFAKIPGQPSDRCAVHSNHIQIVSSAVNPASGRSDALSDYSVVQQAIWQQLPADNRITPDLFAFSPMPKDDAINTGLGVFHNSFQSAAKWEGIRHWFLEDIKMVYANWPDGHLHGDKANSADWRWKSWMPTEVKPISDPMYKTNEDKPWIRIDDLQRMLSHSGVREFPRPLSGSEQLEVSLPSNPGFVFVFLLIEFIHNLGPKEGRKVPTVEYELKNGDGSEPKFVIKVTLQNDGAVELWKCYEIGAKSNGDACGDASKALRALGSKTPQGDYEVNTRNGSGKLVPNIVKVVTPRNVAWPIIANTPSGTIAITLEARHVNQ